MAALPALELIAINGIGTDAVDLGEARARRIRVTTTPDVLTDDVADLAIGLLLATARRISLGDRFVREGRWAGVSACRSARRSVASSWVFSAWAGWGGRSPAGHRHSACGSPTTTSVRSAS